MCTAKLKYLVPLLLLLCLGCGPDERLICRYPIAQTRAEMSFETLKIGNQRFVNGKSVHPHQNTEWRAVQAANHQSPLAAVLACADSRVPVEMLFDQGVGDIFVIRTAGNAWNSGSAGSLEYASLALDVPLIVVMGHTNCGAVDAAWLEGRYEGELWEVLKPIYALAEAYKKQHPERSGPHDAEGFQAVTRANIYETIRAILENCPEIREKYENYYLDIVPAEYDLATGAVIWLEPEDHRAVQ